MTAPRVWPPKERADASNTQKPERVTKTPRAAGDKVGKLFDAMAAPDKSHAPASKKPPAAHDPTLLEKKTQAATPGEAATEKRRPLKGGEPFHPKSSLVKMRGC